MANLTLTGNIMLSVKAIKRHGLLVYAVIANDTMIIATAMSEGGARSIMLKIKNKIKNNLK